MATRKRHRAGRSGKKLVGNAKAAAALAAISAHLGQAQGEIGSLINVEDRVENPARTKYMDGLWDQIEKQRRELNARAWRRG
jgi:hypothetical protein